MKGEIEILLRHSSTGTFLNAYIGNGVEKNVSLQEISSLAEDGKVNITLEMPVLAEWITDKDVRKKYSSMNEILHLRIPVSSFNVIVND